jgi:hypothetical protein
VCAVSGSPSSVVHPERGLQLPGLIEGVGRTRRLQIWVRSEHPVVAGQVLGVQQVERLDDALEPDTAYINGLRQSDVAQQIARGAA